MLAFDRLKAPPIARFLAYCIAGHHAGLPDWQPDEAGDLAGRLFASPLDGIWTGGNSTA